jgi:hypothetical protein
LDAGHPDPGGGAEHRRRGLVRLAVKKGSAHMKLWIVAALVILVALYVIGGRKWLKSKPWMKWFYKLPLVQWVELTFFKKSESILWGRFLQVLGYGLTFVAGLGGIDLTPMALVLPENLRWLVSLFPMVIALAGHIQVQLRMETTMPIEQVALPDNVPPQVAEAAAVATRANEQVTATIVEAKQAGQI